MKPGVRTTEFAVCVLMILFGGALVWRGHLTEGVALATSFAGHYVGLRAGKKIGNGGTELSRKP